MPNRYVGAMLGLGIGDALGFPTEFMSASEIQRCYGPPGVTGFVKPPSHPLGSYSDDTQMTLALARALLRAGHEDLDTLMAAVGKEFVAWYRSPDNNRAPGHACMTACGRLAGGAHWTQSGVAGAKGCGTAMRSAPIGLLYHGDTERIVEVGTATALVTHGHACALAGSVATALLVSDALDGLAPEAMFERLCEVTAPISEEFVAAVRLVPTVLDAPPDRAFEVLGEAWVAEEAVACALYCFWRSPNDYPQTVLAGANASGDSDSIACIAGAISGAYNGAEAIPAQWRGAVENAAGLEDVGRGLWEGAGQDRA